MMPNGKPGGDGQLLPQSDPLMLYILSAVHPKNMPGFMNSSTWMAAWLQHFFGWDRLVVGYSLTDVPERVLEIYSIHDGKCAKEVLEKLGALGEHEALLKLCNPWPRDEVLMPVVDYKKSPDVPLTPLGAYVRNRKLESESVGKLNNLLEEYEKLKGQIARRVNEINTEIVNLSRLEERAGSGQPGLECEIKELEEKIVELKRGLGKLELQAAGLQKPIKEVDADLEENQKERQRIIRNLPDYFLYVSVDVIPECGVLKAYIDQMSRLLDDFDWEFVAAGCQKRPRAPLDRVHQRLRPTPQERRVKGASGESEYIADEIIHLWKFKDADANELYHQMVELRENERYTALTEKIESQWHMLMCDWEALSRTKRDIPLPRGKKSHPPSSFERPTPPGKDDLLILTGNGASRDGEIYWLKGSEYQTEGHKAPLWVIMLVQPLVSLGVVMAAIPLKKGSPDEARMFLVNMSGIQRPVDSPSPTPPESDLQVADSAVATNLSVDGRDDLVVLDRKGKVFYWIKRSEYQNPAHSLDESDPILAAQLRLLTNQGVLLADVPGETLPDVKDMGCLVNLRAIIQGLKAG